MWKRQLLALSSALILAGCASDRISHSKTKPPHVEFSLRKVAFQIGETTIHAQVRQFGTKKLTMVNLHDDEQTSVDAAVVVLQKEGGRLVELTHTGKRRVVFSLASREYSFDPNRIFSKAGVRKTVRSEGTVPTEAHLAVDRFASQFLHYFKLHQQPAVMTLHNNGDAGSLSIHSYKPGGELETDTAELHIDSAVDADDFYFVTDKRIFEELKKRHFNVILQDNSIRRDDGSLSVFAGRHSIPYANVEAQPDHFNEQVRMIEVVSSLMR
jgi:hypothetical protein